MANYVALRVEINGEVSDKEWTGLRLKMASSKHVAGYVVMRHYLGKKTRLSGRTFYNKRSRIQVTWGEFPEHGLNRIFRGYITTHQSGAVAKDANGPYVPVTYYVVGTSDPLQAKHAWTGHTWSGAAKAIAKRHKLRAVVHQTPRLTNPLVQHQSDFKFLVDGADKTGYRFFVWNTTLFFVNPTKMLNHKPSNTPMFEGDAIHDLDVDSTEAEDTDYVVTGTAADGSTVTATSSKNTDPEQDDEGTLTTSSVEYDSTVVESLAEAQAAIEARVLSDKSWVVATAKTDGDARVIPGMVVYLTDIDMPEEHRGLWFVNSVEHYLDISDSQRPENYTLEMELTRDRMRSVTMPETGEDTWVDLNDPTQSVPWEASDEWENIDYDGATDSEGAWQADYYGEDDSQVDY